MHVITSSCFLLLWMHTLTSVKSQAVNCRNPVIEDGVVPGNVNEYNENDVLSYTCNPGYKRAQEIDSRCTNSGGRSAWIPTPACEAIKCELMLPPVIGTTYEPAYRNRFSPGEKVRVTCGDRYWISDGHSRSAETTCKEDGQWTIRPVCQEVACSRPRDTYLSYWSDSWSWQPKKLADTVRYRCRSGYRSTDGATWATCTRDGWEPNPLCQEIKCVMLSYDNADIIGGIQPEYRYNDRVQYKCRRGYEGSFTLTCGENGWRGSNQCTEICTVPEIPPSLLITTDSPGSQVMRGQYLTFTCEDSTLIIKGNATVECLANEQWSNPLPACEAPQGCGRPPPLSDGDTKTTTGNQYQHNDRVEYVCQAYYVMEGGPFKTCTDGEWTGKIRCLQPCTVNTEDMNRHNIRFRYSRDDKLYSEHNEVINFVCARGRHAGALGMRQRCEHGVIQLPTCQ
ncbi:complement factor H-like isoform X2 [Archocentrus centrarchus]|uniref:complement factor H-like isoform X2 n=1 Tax=Archocentrus centrarchus TaxID=63155 RepID=UPI0011E9BB88|nr:complement factor H-like isoform X2 [Archocentrus centrarchus]